MQHSLLVILVLWFFPSFVFAAEDDSAAAVAGREALWSFAETEPYLNERDDRLELLRELSSRCDGFTRGCAQYVSRNRSEALTALPNNSAYWDRFEAFLEQQSIGQVTRDRRSLPRFQKVIDAANRWWLRDLARDGQIRPDKMTAYWSHVRRRLEQSNTSLEKLVFLHLNEILSNTMNYAMAQAAAEGNRDQLEILAAQITPMTLPQRSFELAFAGELELIQRNLSKPAERYEDAIARIKGKRALTDADFITKEQYETLQQDKLIYLEQLPTLFEALTVTSELSAADYWRDPEQPIRDALEGLEPNKLLNSGLPTWAGYVGSAQLGVIRSYLLRVLADAYADGVVLAESPKWEPPDRWAWEWREEKQELCLAPTTAQYDAGALCAPYLSRTDF